MTLYDTIFTRRQVRKYSDTPLDQQTLEGILSCISNTEQLAGQQVSFELASADAVSGGAAQHYLLSYCDNSSAAYANVGYVMQKADLYIQNMGLGSGWFMNVQPKKKRENHCITLAFGYTEIPVRDGADRFKRLPIEKISPFDNAVARSVRLAPSALNSQPWKLEFTDGRVIIKDVGHGLMRPMLRNKLNKVDVGIATRHAVIALEHEGKCVTGMKPISAGKEFAIEIRYW